jgi:hypothetical protein
MRILGSLIGKGYGAIESQIIEVQDTTGLAFPDDYRRFIAESDGLLFETQSVKILSLKESLEYFKCLRKFGLTQTWGYFPISDNEDSNPWCICCKEPLAGYIVRVAHDDGAQLKFRSIEALFEGIKSVIEDDILFLDDLDGDFKSKRRTPQDIAAGRQLLSRKDSFSDGDRQDACCFAMWLLAEDQVDEIIPLLDDKDFFVARDARDMLSKMHSSKAKEALRSRKKMLAALVKKSVNLL